MAETQPPQTTPPAEPNQPPRRKRRKWPWAILILLVLIALLIVLLPAIASTPPVRSFVVSQINNNLNGRATIDDWSLGWTGGIDVSGVKVYDDQARLILEMEKLQTQLSLLDAIKGNLALGKTTVDRLNLVQMEIDENGQVNYAKLVKQSPRPSEAAPPGDQGEATAELPNITGEIQINQLRGTIVKAGVAQPIFIEPSRIAITITDINQPISNDVNLVFRVGDNAPGTIKLSGQADIAEAGKLALEKLTARQSLSIASLDLAAASAFAPADITLAGVANGALEINATGTTDGQVQGEIAVDNFSAGGAALKGDRFATSKLSLPVQVAVSQADPNRTILRIEKLGATMPEATIAVSGNVSQQALARLAEQQAPGEEGILNVAVNVPNIATIANQLPNTLNLVEGAQLTGGSLSATTDVKLSADRAVVAQKLDLQAMGTNSGQPITLEPIHLDATASLLPGGADVPGLRDIALLLTSKFAEVRANAASLAAIGADGKFDLAELQRQLGQFVDFGAMDLAGTGAFTVATQGDVTQDDQPINGNVTASFASLRVVTANGNVILNDENIDLAVAGALKTSAEQTGASLSKLELKTSSDLLHLQVPEGKQLVVQMSQDGKFQGNGELAMSADLARLNRLSKDFAGPTTQPAEPTDEIKSGRLDGTIQFARADQPMTNIIGDFKITNLTVGDLLQNEQIAIAVRADAPDALDSLAASADVSSTFAKISVADARLLLSTQTGGEAQAASVWEMIQRATVTVDAPNIEKVYALAESAMSPATQPVEDDATALPPLRLTKGAATAKIDIARESARTKLNVREMRVTGLVLRRGDNRWAMPKDRAIDLKLAADLATSGEDVSAIEVTQLGGDLGVATLAMSQPISIQNPMTNPAVNAAIEITGTLDDAAPLLETLGGTEFPYRGQYAIQQNLVTQEGIIKATGGVNTKQLKAMDGDKVTFAEDELAITNDVSMDPTKKVANISSLTVATKSSNAVNLAMKGTLNDWEIRRQFKEMTVDLSYDLEQLWKMIYPMLAPETQESLKTLQIAGKDKTQLTIAGSFPSTQPTNQAISSLDVQGGFPIALVDYEGSRIENLNPSFRLRGGVFRFVKDVTASFNGGTLDLSRIEVDLRQDIPRATFVKDHQLVKDATINPLLGKSLGQFVNPMFANSTRAQGKLNVKIDYCENLALGEAIKTADSGRMKMTFSLLDMDIASPMGSLVLGEIAKVPLVGSFVKPDDVDVYTGSIRNAVVTVENGTTTQDITFEVLDPKKAQQAQQVVGKEIEIPVYPMNFKGNVNMSSLAQSLTVTIPQGLLEKWNVPSEISKAFGGGLPLSLGGTTLQPKLDLGNIGQSLIEAQIQQNLGGGSGDRKDPLGGLLEGVFGGGRKGDDEKQPAEEP